MDPAAVDAMSSLVFRDVPRAAPTDVRRWASALSGRDRALVEAAAALRSGDPRRARDHLAGYENSALSGALRVATYLAERNRFPGGRGAVLEEGDVEAFEEPPPPEPGGGGEALLTIAIGQVEAMGSTWRSIAGGAGATVLERIRRLQADVAGTDAAWLVTGLTLIEADVQRLAGDPAGASATLAGALAACEATGDAPGAAACLVMSGDWHAAPQSSPEVLGLSIDATTLAPGEPDLAAAATAYESAQRHYEAGGNRLGLATVALRTGYLDAAGGNAAAWLVAATEAERLAGEAGDQWLAALAAVHRSLASVTAGGAADADGLTARAGRLHDAGSRGWVRGLVRLVVAQSTVLRDAGDFVGARRALRTARGMAEASAAPIEVVDVTDRLLALYGRTSFPVPRAVLELATVRGELAAGTIAGDPIAWARLVQRAQLAVSMGTQAADGDVLMAAVPVLDRIAGTVPDGFGAMVQLMREMVVKSAASMRVMGPLYAGRAARRDGRPDEAAALEGQALAAVDSAGADAPFLRAVVLGTVGRKEEATAIVDELVRDGLDPSYIAALYQRLDAPERALAALPPVDAPSERPWEASALRAQTLAATGRIAEAAEHADRGIEAFETALARYARDVLKTSATEDLDGADLYLTRILADAPTAAVGNVEALRRSFATSDRARSVSNSERIESTRSEPAVRRWLALGSRWAAAYEDLGNMVTSLDDVDVDAVRRRLRHVEDELDDAEDELLAVDPELLAASRRRRPPLDIDAVAAALPAGAVLLQYHLWNDELLAWAMTAGGLRFQRQEVDGADLASDARRFLLAAGGSAALDDALDGRLAALLVDPWATELEAHERIVVVPHGALSVVPFHLLAHAGGRLGERHVLSPAAAHLPRLAAPAAPTARSFVLGDPAYAPDRQLRRLPGSGVEARAVQAALGVDRVHLDVGAARDVVLAEAPGSPLLHLATHGLLDERGPNRAYLALAGVDELTVADLLALDIEGAFVVLSACNSGRGRATAGGDVVGLIRAVLASGAGSALASLWPVDDEVGCVLMARFYEHLVAEGDAAAALHRASNDVRLTSPADRHAAYEELAAHFGTSGAPAGRRDVTATEPHSQVGDSAAWAPFVYVGR